MIYFEKRLFLFWKSVYFLVENKPIFRINRISFKSYQHWGLLKRITVFKFCIQSLESNITRHMCILISIIKHRTRDLETKVINDFSHLLDSSLLSDCVLCVGDHKFSFACHQVNWHSLCSLIQRDWRFGKFLKVAPI